MNTAKWLTSQKIISTKHFQAKFATMVKEAQKNEKYYNVVKNSESIGVFLPTIIWESLLEDIEALGSKDYKKKIAKSRKEANDGDTYNIEEAFAI